MADIFLQFLKLLTKWKPSWLYEAMPFVYVLAGLVTIYHFNTLVGYGAGALLLIAATLIWGMRLENRAKDASFSEHSQLSPRPDR